MAKSKLIKLPIELVLKIAEYLEFPDIWYMGTCSRQTRFFSRHVILYKYHFDLAKPTIISSFTILIHGAIAYLGRYAITDNHMEGSVLQSVSNYLTVALYDGTPVHELEYLLDKSLGILVDHCLFDPTLRHPLICSSYLPKETGVVLVDAAATLHSNLTALFDSAGELHHTLLMKHVYRLLLRIKEDYHANPFAIHMHRDFCSFIQLLCALLKNELLIPADIDELILPIQSFFITRGADILVFSVKSKDPAYWSRWLEETKLRHQTMSQLLRALKYQHPTQYLRSLIHETTALLAQFSETALLLF
ncbi:hypothetical protein K501DRAFT_271711 [Backusella circina FSU 941]|nr:hypothetical protein K501DRAFT_271711 [Backusella circina FSU 941]